MIEQFKNPISYIPKKGALEDALHNTRVMAIGAHQDDNEIMGFPGIAECYNSNSQRIAWFFQTVFFYVGGFVKDLPPRKEKSFFAVVVTNGKGSPKSRKYAGIKPEEMVALRNAEQIKVAKKGRYAGVILLNHESSDVKKENPGVEAEIRSLIEDAKPRVIFTHSLLDSHETHAGVAARVIYALRDLRARYMPEHVYCPEVWRGQDWMNHEDLVTFDVTKRLRLAKRLLSVYKSQIAGGKNYGEATLARWKANATYYESHDVDVGKARVLAIDIRPLLDIPDLSKEKIIEYMRRYIKRFDNTVTKVLDKVL